MIREFRVSGNLDNAFDNMAAEAARRERDRPPLPQHHREQRRPYGGELAAQAGLTNGAITGVLDRLEKAGPPGAGRSRRPSAGEGEGDGCVLRSRGSHLGTDGRRLVIDTRECFTAEESTNRRLPPHNGGNWSPPSGPAQRDAVIVAR